MAIIIKKKRSKREGVEKDASKELIFKGLSSLLNNVGIGVRREELKRGPGWKVSSGACRIQDSRTIFVDRMLPQDDQISFLLDQILELKISPREEDIKALPEAIQKHFQIPLPQVAEG